MDADINRVILRGRVGGAPELRHTDSGHRVCRVSVATSEKWEDKERTEWHRCTGWADVADRMAQLQVGQAVLVEGSIRTRSWEKDGTKRYATEVQILSLLALSPARKKRPAQDEHEHEPTGHASAADENAAPPRGDDIPF